MKKMIKNLMLVAVAAMAFVACSQDVNDINILPKQTALNFTARFVEDTRAYFGEKGEEGYPVYWAGGEEVTFVAPAADYDGTYTTYAEAVKADEQGIEATFDVVFDNPIKAGTVYAYLGEGWNPMSNYAYVNDYQTPTATSVDPNCIMASTSFEYDGETMEVSGDFAHGAGYGKMTVKGFEGKTISSVELSFVGTNYCNYTLNVADIEEHTYWFASEENEVESFTITVVADGAYYSKEVEIGSDKHLYFKKGLVSKFSVSDLVKDPIQLETPIVTTSFANGKVTASWNTIENAESYTVKVDGTVVEEEYKETSYSFDAAYSTYYSISVIANAAEGSADYVDSYEAFAYITTPLDINMVTDYTVTLTNYTIDPTSSYGKLFRFTSDDGTKWINLPVNPNLADILPAGTYTGVLGNWSYSSDASLEFNYYDTEFNYASMYSENWASSKSGVEVVRESDDTWSITIVVFTYDNYSIKYVYSEEPKDPNALDYTFDTLSWNSQYSRFELSGGGNGITQFYLNENDRPGNNSIKANTYTYAGNTNSTPNTGTFSLRYLLGSGAGSSHYVNDASMSVTIEDGQYKIVITILSAGNANVVGKTFGYKGLPEGWPTPSGSEGGEEPEEPEQPELTALATPELTVSASGNTVNASWGAVDGAANYTVTLNGENKGTITETYISFSDLAYSTEYTVTVVANPADSTANTASEVASMTVKTEADPNAPSTSDIEVTEYSASVGGNYTDAIFSYNDESNRKIGISISFNKAASNGLIPAGTYSLSNYLLESAYCYWGYGLSSSEKEPFSTLEVIVSVNNDLNTFVVTGTTNTGRNISFTYTGKL